MQGLTFDGGREVSLREFPEPTAGPGEVVLRITASGMCGSDLHYYRADPDVAEAGGQRGTVAGHEPAGVVEQVGPGTDLGELSVGDRVMVAHYAGCNRCGPCRAGWLQMCTGASPRTYGKNAHGGHAPRMTVSAQSVLPLGDGLSDLAAATIGCGTGTAWGGLERLGDVGGADLVVFGQGPVGLSATMLATARGARVIAVDPAGSRRDQARAFGAWQTIDPDEGDVAAAVRDLTGGGAPLVLETSGATAAAAAGLECLRPWGRLCVVGLGGAVQIDVRRVLSRQLTVLTSWSLSTVQQLACANFVAQQALPIDELFTHRWSLSQAEEAYADFDQQRAGKGVFVFDASGS